MKETAMFRGEKEAARTCKRLEELRQLLIIRREDTIHKEGPESAFMKTDLVKNGKSAAKEWETLVDILHLECVATSSLRVPERFKSAIHLFLRRPHLLNKRVSGARPMDADGDVPQVDFKQLLSKLNDVLPDISMHVVQCVDYPDASRIMYFWRNWILVTRQGSEISDIVVEGPTWFLFLPLQASESLAKSRPQVPYVLSAQEKFKETWEIKLHLPVINEEADTGSDWLKSVLFPKLVQWASEESNDSTGSQASLRLIDLPVYCQHYNRIKRDFVPWIRENWNLSTDPLKHITEDAGISSYLLTLWKNPSTSLCHTSGSSPIRFVDVGCGNGLLTYLLNQHPAICLGFGIDLRARATWKSLDPSGDLLREEVVHPETQFDNVNWIIGNHCDELAPWIPIFAARSRPAANFLLLPCCPFQLDGRRYSRKDHSQSQFQEYCEYLKELAKKCGFRVEVDRLKIPSTKRIALIGLASPEHASLRRRLLESFSVDDVDCRAAAVIWKARERDEIVRNATQIQKDVIEHVIDEVGKYLINKSSSNGVPLRELAGIFEASTLGSLKEQCGGLQTVLKNHGHIFRVISGHVVFNCPQPFDPATASSRRMLRLRSRPCWFFHKHPSGCPLSAEQCSFAH